MPFAGYKNFQDCLNKNQNKGDPEAYCGHIKHKVEDSEEDSDEESCKKHDIFEIVEKIKKNYGDTKKYDLREVLDSVFNGDFTEDYPVSGYTKKDGTKVKKHTRGEILEIKPKKLNIRMFKEDPEFYRKLQPEVAGRASQTSKTVEIWGKSKDPKLWSKLISHETLHHILDEYIDPEYHHEIMNKLKMNIYDFVEDFEQGDMALDFGEVLEIYAKKFDNLTEDAGRVGRPRTRGLKTGTAGAKVSGAKRTKIGQQLLKQFGAEAFKVGAPQTLTVPFSVINTETGISIQGNVVQNLEKNIIELTPVSSSNVKAAGQFKNELLVQFHPSGLDPQRTYRYAFGRPEEAREAYQALTSSPSPGRWIWKNMRGHEAGQPLEPTKFAPSLSPPGQGLPTIGGTSASLVNYQISNRVPVKRVQGFEKMSSLLKRETSNPATDPGTGARVEKLLSTRKELRELNLSPTKMPNLLAKLPRL
jgi:hypothetical protein